MHGNIKKWATSKRKEGRTVLYTLRPAHYELEAVIREINSENLHEEIDFGHPVGKEIL